MTTTNATTITFRAGLPPAGLRRNSQYRSGAALARLKNAYSEEVWCAAQLAVMEQHVGLSTLRAYDSSLFTAIGCPWQYAALYLDWRHIGVGPDRDNALASCKVLIDVLGTRGRRPLGIIVDDGPECLVEVTMDVVRVAHKWDEEIIVRIERREEA